MHRAERALKKLGIQTTDLIATAFSPASVSSASLSSSTNSSSSSSTSASSSLSSSSLPAPPSSSPSSSSHSSHAWVSPGSLRPDEYCLFWSQVSSARECTVFLLEMLNRFVAVLEREGKHALALLNAAALPSPNPSGAATSPPPAPPSVDTSTLDFFLTTLNFITLCMPIVPGHPPLRTWLAGWAKAEGSRDCHSYPGVKEAMRLLTLRCEGGDLIGPVIIGASTLHTAGEFLRLQAALSDCAALPTYDEDVMRSPTEAVFFYHHLQQLARQPAYLPVIVQSTFNKLLTLHQQMKINAVVAGTTLSALLHVVHALLSLCPLPRSYELAGMLATLQQFYVWPEPLGSMVRDVLTQLYGEYVLGGEMMRSRLMEEVTGVAVKWTEDDADWGSACFYLLDADERHTAQMVRVMDLTRWRSTAVRYGKDEAVLLSVRRQGEVVMNLLDMEGLMGDAELSGMKAMSDEAVSALFNQCMIITREIAEQEGEDGERREYKATALQQLRDYVHELAASSPASAALPSSLSSATLTPPYLPSLPAMHHIYLPCRLTYEMLGKASYPTTPSYTSLLSLLTHFRSCTPSDPQHALTVRLVLAGSDDLLHSFLCAYMLVRQAKRELLEGLDLRLHVLPWGRRGELSAWVARNDGWYARHVYSVFREKALVLPSMRMEDEDLVSAASAGSASPTATADVNAPGAFYRACVEQYVAESGYSLELTVWKVEAWVDQAVESAGGSALPDHVIPFLQRVDVSSPSSELTLRYRKIDCQGILAPEKADDPALYASLLFQAVPRKDGPVFAAETDGDGLHFAARLHRNYQRGGGRACVIGLEGRGVVGEVDVRGAGGKDGVHVNIDGQQFGPYHRVRLSAAKDGEDVVTFPMQTFFPIAG